MAEFPFGQFAQKIKKIKDMPLAVAGPLDISAKKPKYLNQYELHQLLNILELSDKVSWDYISLHQSRLSDLLAQYSSQLICILP